MGHWHQHGGRFGHRFGLHHGFGRPWRDREAWVARLEEYQRDLEQEVADVADLIRRLKADQPAEPAQA